MYQNLGQTTLAALTLALMAGCGGAGESMSTDPAENIGTSENAFTVEGIVPASALSAFSTVADKAITATCPAGKRVVGGTGLISGATHVVLTRLEPRTGASDSYTVEAHADDVGTSSPWAVEAVALCAAPITGLQIVSASTAPAVSSFRSINATCPAGKRAIGSGGRIHGGSGHVDLGTVAIGAGFGAASAINAAGTADPDGFAGAWSVTSFAVCVPPESFFDLELVTVQSPLDATSPKKVTASCPIGKRSTGGTVFTSTPGTVQQVLPTLGLSGIEAVGAANFATGGIWDMTVTALCAQ